MKKFWQKPDTPRTVQDPPLDLVVAVAQVNATGPIYQEQPVQPAQTHQVLVGTRHPVYDLMVAEHGDVLEGVPATLFPPMVINRRDPLTGPTFRLEPGSATHRLTA